MTKRRQMESASDLSCLKRVGNGSTEHRVIMLKEREKITIGRMSDATVSIPTSVMISRQHATLEQSSSGSWMITDNKSLNGVRINGRTIAPCQATILEDNDIVQLGVAPGPDEPPEFVWRFHSRFRVKRFKFNNDDEADKCASQNAHDVRQCHVLVGDSTPTTDRCFVTRTDSCCNTTGTPADKCDIDSTLDSSHTQSILRQSSSSRESRLPHAAHERTIDRFVRMAHCTDMSDDSDRTLISDSLLLLEQSRRAELEEEQREELRKQMEHLKDEQREELRKQREELENEQREELHKQREHLEEMEQLLKTREFEQQRLEAELREKAVKLQEEQLRLQAEMETVQHKRLDELRVSYELKMVEQESCLTEKLHAERQSLIAERLNIETSLQVEMTKKLKEKDRALEERLLSEKKRLDDILEGKEAEKRKLEEELTGAKCESERVKAEDVSRARDDIMANLAGLMESELQCGICTEVFVKPTTLDCAHSFCASCIAQWMKIKKVCPVCRAPIVTQLRSVVLDSYIDKMVEQLSTEMKDKRQKLINERTAEEAAVAATAQAKIDNANAAAVARSELYLQTIAAIRPTRRGRRSAQALAARLPAPPAVATAILPAPRSVGAMRLPAPPAVSDVRVTRRGAAVMDTLRGSAIPLSAGAATSGSLVTTAGPTPSTSTFGTLTSTSSSILNVTETPAVVNEVTVISDGEVTDSSYDGGSFHSNEEGSSELDDAESGEDSEEDSEDGYFLSNRRPFYGGYGRCYRCGRSGHWSNNCRY